MKHEFALYKPDLLEAIQGQEIVITDKSLIHRIKDILRLKPADVLIFFNKNINVRAEAYIFERKLVTFKILERRDNEELKPNITFLLPVLRKDAFTEAVYSLAELGANRIQLVITQKIQRHWSEKEMERLERIIIAAAEQSKSFAYPEILSPISFKQCLQSLSEGAKIFFDPNGNKAEDVVHELQKIHSTKIYLLIGPEGDLSRDEKEELENYNFKTCALGPTVMRAQQAAAIGLGILRSFLL